MGGEFYKTDATVAKRPTTWDLPSVGPWQMVSALCQIKWVGLI